MNKLIQLSLLFLGAACTTAPDDQLSLDVLDTNHVAGTYREGDVAIAFDFARDGDHHVKTFHSGEGDALLTTTLDGAFETTVVLGGRLQISGTATMPNPTVDGDASALDELHARPEAALLKGLRSALEAEGIDGDLLDPQPDVQGVYDVGNNFLLFEPGDSMLFWSLGWGMYTSVHVWNPWSSSCAFVNIVPYAAAPSQFVIATPPSGQFWGYGRRDVTWWGALFRVENAATNRNIAGHSCRPAQVLIRVD